MATPDLKPNQQLSTRAVRARVLGLAWPVMAESILQTLTQVVSMMLVGHLGAKAVASIGLSMQPLFMFASIFMGAGVAVTALTARATGAGDPAEAGRATAQAVLISLIIASAGALFILFGGRWLVIIMGAEPDVVTEGTRYLEVMLPGLFAMWMTTVLTGALRGAGDTKTPMVVNMTVSLVSFGLNILLVYGLFGFPALGVIGAGLATSIARVLGGVMLFAPWFANRSRLPLDWRTDFRWDGELMSRLARVGLPGIGERLLMSSAGVLYVRMIAVLGTTAYAAHQIGGNAELISVMPGFAFGVAATTLVGQHLGAERPDLAKHDAVECVRVSCAFVGLVGLAFIFCPGLILRLYTNDSEIIRLASLYLIMMGFSQIHQAFGFVYAGALRGAGDTGFVMWTALIGAWGARVGLTYLLVIVLKQGLVGAWWAMVADGVIKAILGWWRFRGGAWEKAVV